MSNIDSNTKIEITIGKFFGLIGSIITGMLTMFVGFYFMVFQPKVDTEIQNMKEFYGTMMEKDKELLSKELEPFIEHVETSESKLENIEQKVDGIAGRFDDLNKLNNQLNNTGGLSR